MSLRAALEYTVPSPIDLLAENSSMALRSSAVNQVRAVVCSALWLVALHSCGKPGLNRPAPRLVLLYATCTLNKNYLSPYNASVSFTPNLAAFAQDSILFTRHQTEAGQSAIAYASIFTGTHAHAHGRYRPGTLSDDVYTLAEAFADAGYETFFWGAHSAAGANGNYNQGVKPENTFDEMLQAEDPSFVEILEKLNADEEYKAFIITNFTVTHGPYRAAPVKEFRSNYPDVAQEVTRQDFDEYYPLYRAHHLALSWSFPSTRERLGLSDERLERLSRVLELAYKANVNRLDGLFGRVVEEVQRAGVRDESLIAFTADHGEVLYRENAPYQWSHSHQLADEVLSVPLMIRLPGGWSALREYREVSRSIDVFATLLGLSGVDVGQARDTDGVDLSPVLLGQRRAPRLLAYSHTSMLPETVFKRMYNEELWDDWNELRERVPAVDPDLMWVGLRAEEILYKLRRMDGVWRFEVFDLERDPLQMHNLFEDDPRRHGQMERKLRNYKNLLVAGYATWRNGQRGSDDPLPDEEKVLRSLGYVQ